jgi:hypothetical protein
MPEVKIKYKTDEDRELLVPILEKLPEIIAEELHVEEIKEAHLTPSNIGIDVRQHGPLNKNTLPIEIIIEAHFFEERKANIQERVKKIHTRMTEGHKPFPQCYIWVHWINGSFFKF